MGCMGCMLVFIHSLYKVIQAYIRFRVILAKSVNVLRTHLLAARVPQHGYNAVTSTSCHWARLQAMVLLKTTSTLGIRRRILVAEDGKKLLFQWLTEGHIYPLTLNPL